MRLPEIREEIEALSKLLAEAGRRLDTLAKEMKRRPTLKRARPKNRPMTEALAEEIREYAAYNPKLSQQEIANHYKVNTGRVSEALRGRRT